MGYDFFEKSGYMQDRIHPNANGKKHIAHKVFDAFFNSTFVDLMFECGSVWIWAQ